MAKIKKSWRTGETLSTFINNKAMADTAVKRRCLALIDRIDSVVAEGGLNAIKRQVSEERYRLYFEPTKGQTGCLSIRVGGEVLLSTKALAEKTRNSQFDSPPSDLVPGNLPWKFAGAKTGWRLEADDFQKLSDDQVTEFAENCIKVLRKFDKWLSTSGVDGGESAEATLSAAGEELPNKFMYSQGDDLTITQPSRPTFTRVLRTPSSERWLAHAGRALPSLIDLHLAAHGQSHATFVLLGDDWTAEQIHELVVQFDEEVVDSADLASGNLHVDVFRGTEAQDFSLAAEPERDDGEESEETPSIQ